MDILYLLGWPFDDFLVLQGGGSGATASFWPDRRRRLVAAYMVLNPRKGA